MAFASIYVPDFMVQALARAEPALHHSALALIDGVPPLESVVAVNGAAARTGIRPGMTKSQVAQFGIVEIRRRSRMQEHSAHAALLDLGWSLSPRIEDTAPDAILLDLAGLGSLFGSEENIARQLAQRASGFGLLVNVAVAGHAEAAFHAARGFSGVTVIPPGEEAGRLGPLPVSVLSPPAEVLEILDCWGVRTYEALAKLPVLELSERLGQQGVRLHEQARGASLRSLVVAEPEPGFQEAMALEYAVEELEPLAFLLGRLLDQLCARLTARSLAASAIRLRFDLDPDVSPEQGPENSRRGPQGASKTYQKTLSLPVPMRDSKLLLKLLRLQLQSDPPQAPIVKVILAADSARPRVAQRGLFLASYPDPEKLELTLARLAHLVGDSNIGSPRLSDTHRPDAFQMARFEPQSETAQNRTDFFSARSSTRRGLRANNEQQGHEMGFRVFRPPIAAHVEVREGQPVRVSFRGLDGAVMNASGPWRSSGEWWQENAWHHDEWDVEIRWPSRNPSRNHGMEDSISPGEPQTGVYRIYYDSICRGWFVEGMYD